MNLKIFSFAAILLVTAAPVIAESITWQPVTSGSQQYQPQQQFQPQQDAPRYGSDVTHRHNSNGTTTTNIGGSEFTNGSNNGNRSNNQACQTIGVSTFCR